MTPVFRPDLQNPYPFSDLAFRQKLCHGSLDQSINQKFIQMHFEFVYFYFFLFHLKLIRKIHSYAPIVRSKTILDSREKFTPVFRAKRSKNHTLWGGTYLYGLYKGFFHPPPPPGVLLTYFFLHRSSVC